MAPSIKICGINTAVALDAALGARADHVGLVFFAPSPRNVSLTDAAQLSARAAGRIGKVGLFVDATDATIAEAVAAGGLDAIQLHGIESPARAAELRARHGLPVWKALPVTQASDLDGAKAYVGAADLILFDARAPVGADLPGGLGLVFDWTLLAGYRAPLPWGLAGGLSPDNVGEALKIANAPLVDVSSGVESAPGIKDVDSIAAFCKAARKT